jgi:hypothetical protein
MEGRSNALVLATRVSPRFLNKCTHDCTTSSFHHQQCPSYLLRVLPKARHRAPVVSRREQQRQLLGGIASEQLIRYRGLGQDALQLLAAYADLLDHHLRVCVCVCARELRFRERSPDGNLWTKTQEGGRERH